MVHDVSHGVQIEAFIYSRLKGREICQRALLAPPARSTIISLRISLRRAYLKRSTTVKRVLCAFALYGLVSYPGSLTLPSSGRYKIHWLNLILKVVAAILAA